MKFHHSVLLLCMCLICAVTFTSPQHAKAADALVQLSSFSDELGATFSPIYALPDTIVFGTTKSDSLAIPAMLYSATLAPASTHAITTTTGRFGPFLPFGEKTIYMNYDLNPGFLATYRYCELSPTQQATCSSTVQGTKYQRLLGPVVLGDAFYTLLAGGYTDQKLYRSSGDPLTTTVVQTIKTSLKDAPSDWLVAFKSSLLFGAYDDQHGHELWVSDGTTAGTHLFKDIRAGAESSAPIPLGELGGRYYFAADDGTHGQEVWVTDGTDAGTQLVADLNPGSAGSIDQSTQSVVVGNQLYFIANEGVHGAELWATDGTAAGTHLVADITPGPQGTSLSQLTAMNDTLFFAATSSATGQALWRSNGTLSTTHLVADINSGPDDAQIQNMTALNGQLYFSANDGTNGTEPWRSDGTAAGTKLIRDLTPAGMVSQVGSFAAFQQQIVFAAAGQVWAYDPNQGSDLYVTAASLAGVQPNSTAALYLTYGNSATPPAENTRLRVTLDPVLQYVSDTSGITPVISGNTLEWDLPTLNNMTQHTLAIRVQTPAESLGHRFTVQAEVLGATNEVDTSDNQVAFVVFGAKQLFLPLLSD